MYNEKEKIKKSKRKSKKTHRFFFLPFKDSERVLSKNEKRYFKILNGKLIINALLIILGLILCFVSFKANIYLGIIFIGEGIINVCSYLMKDNISLFSFSIIYGIVGIIIGIVTMFVKENIMVGIWLIYTAITNLDLSFRLKKVEEKSWNFILMTSVLTIFIGILAITNPFININEFQVIGAFII